MKFIIRLLGALMVLAVFFVWAVAGYAALTGPQPTKLRCDDGYVLVSGVTVMGWPGRWVCMPGKEAVLP